MNVRSFASEVLLATTCRGGMTRSRGHERLANVSGHKRLPCAKHVGSNAGCRLRFGRFSDPATLPPDFVAGLRRSAIYGALYRTSTSRSMRYATSRMLEHSLVASTAGRSILPPKMSSYAATTMQSSAGPRTNRSWNARFRCRSWRRSHRLTNIRCRCCANTRRTRSRAARGTLPKIGLPEAASRFSNGTRRALRAASSARRRTWAMAS